MFRRFSCTGGGVAVFGSQVHEKTNLPKSERPHFKDTDTLSGIEGS